MKDSSSTYQPPKAADRFLRWFCREELLEEVKGDLFEYYLLERKTKSEWRAGISYWFHVLHFLRPFALKRKIQDSNFNIMYKSYFKYAWRNMQKHRTNTLMNLLSLGVGMACFIFIFIYIKGELSYDKFHNDSDRIHRVVIDLFESDGGILPDATTPPALAIALQRELPEIASSTRVFPKWGRKFLIGANEDQQYFEEELIQTDSSFFDVFSFPFIHGEPKTALDAPDKMVLTRSMALKYFGRENVLGETLTIYGSNNQVKRISAVVEDVSEFSHFTFDFLTRLNFNNIDNNWGWWNYYTYVKVNQDTDMRALGGKLLGFYESARPDQERYAPIYTQAITDIHLKSNLKWELSVNGNMDNIYIFGALGVFVLLISCINYLNLTIADSLKRLKEIGVRKVFGAHKKSLISQFLIEALLTIIFAIVIGGVFAEALFRNMGDVLGRNVSMLQVENLQVFLLIGLTGVVFGILAGLYPALHMSSFKVASAVKGIVSKSGRSAKGLRKTLLVIQFSISTIMIVGTLVVFEQLKYVQNSDLGFESEQVLIIENSRRISNQETFKAELERIPAISRASVADGIIGGLNWTMTVGTPNGVLMNYVVTDPDFIDAMGFELLEGRNFDKERPTDAQGGNLIVNKKALSDLGLTMEDVGKPVPMFSNGDSIINGTVLGVIEDFHFTDFKSEIKPFAFVYRTNTKDYSYIKLNSTNIGQTLTQIEEAWNVASNGAPFEYYFLDETYASLHVQEEKLSNILLYLTFLAVFIAFMGMFAIANMTIKDRLKEIAVRKVLGASVTGVSGMITTKFLALVLVANIIALPLSYYLMSEWLSGFAYRTDLGPLIFTLALGSTLLVAWITVGYQSVRAALINPIRNLRQD